MKFRQAQSATLSLTRSRAVTLAFAVALVGGTVLIPETSLLAGTVGGLDVTYAGGIATAQNTSGTAFAGSVSAVTTDSNGDGVIAGQYGGNGELAVARFLTTGAADTSFGTSGNLNLPDANPGDAYAVATSGTNIAVAGSDQPVGVTSPTPVVLGLGSSGSVSWTSRLSGKPAGAFDAVGFDATNSDVIAAGTVDTGVATTGELVIAAFHAATGALDTTGFCPTVTTTSTYASGATSITVTSPSGIEAGSTVSGIGISGTTVTAISGSVLTLSSATTGAGTLATLTFNCPGATPGEYLHSFAGYCPTVTTTSTYASGVQSINVASASGVEVGSTVSGTGIAPGTTVSAISGNVLTLSPKTTGAGSSATLTFTCLGDGGDTVSPGAIAIDSSSGNIVVAGTTPGFLKPSSCDPLDTFAVLLGPSGAYATAFGGTGYEVIGSNASVSSCTDSLEANAVIAPTTSGWPEFVIAGAQYPSTGRSLGGNGTLLGLASSGAASGVASLFSGSGVTISSATTTSTSSCLLVAGSGGLAAANGVQLVPGTSPALVETGPIPTTPGALTYNVGTSLVTDTSGDLEANFGTAGTAAVPQCTGEMTGCGQGIAVQSDGNFLVVGGVSGTSDVNTTTPSCTASSNSPAGCLVAGYLSVARLNQASITVTSPGTISVSSSTTATFVINLNGTAPGASVTFGTSGSGAGTDFATTSGTVSFSPCSSTSSAITCVSSTIANVKVPVMVPASASGTTTLSLVLSNPQKAGLTSVSASATLDYVSGSSSSGNTGSGSSSSGSSSGSSSSGGGSSSSDGGGTTATTTPTTTTIASSVTTTTLPRSKAPSTPVAGKGYWVVSANGTVKAFGDAKSYGSLSVKKLRGATVAAIAAAPNGTGYWLATSKGAVFAFGSAKRYGSVPAKRLSGTIRSVAVQTNGKGYWLASSTGAVYAFGSAKSYGAVAKGKVSGTVEEMARTSNGRGYWLASTTGAVYHYGNAGSDGQLLGKAHRGSVTGFAALRNSTGYWLVTSVGAVYSYGKVKNYGSITAKMKLLGSVVAITPTPDNKGYWLTSTKGRVFAFGDAHGYGSARTARAVGMATT